MIGIPGQWPWKNGSLMLTFLIPTTRRPGHQLEHAVDQQEGVAVGQEAHDPGDVDRAVLAERQRLGAVGPASASPASSSRRTSAALVWWPER